MICHDAGQNHDPTHRALQIESENFRWAATEAMDLAKISGSVKKHRDDPDNEDLPKTTYDKARADAGGEVFFDVIRMPDASKCYFCHTQVHVGERSVPLWQRDGDVHVVKGLRCNDCHKTGLEHMDTRGYPTEAIDRGQPELFGLTCAGCHLGGSASGGRRARAFPWRPARLADAAPQRHPQRAFREARLHGLPLRPLAGRDAADGADGDGERAGQGAAPTRSEREDVPKLMPMIVEPVFSAARTERSPRTG